MANNVILRTVGVSGDWQPLSASPLIGSVTVMAVAANAEDVHLRTVDDPANEVALVAGEAHDFQRIDLHRIEIKGATSDVVTVVGGTW